ncbi:Heme A synthase [Prochlorococcus sp. MIT 0601]|nr:Heme A synthase [Prochlorococcus sp. MIT 0601]
MLVVIGGATRVMEAGLACPDWPLCYGSFFPQGQMNVRVFLEWLHRLDAFFVGITILIQLVFSLSFKSSLPKWIPMFNGIVLVLVFSQGMLGALTVFELLPSMVVMAHLALALTLLGLMSGVSQMLLNPDGIETPLWWRGLSMGSLIAVVTQCLVGGGMATTWSSQRCIAQGIDCQLLDLHRFTALPVAFFIISFVITSIYKGGWFRDQWPFLLTVFSLLVIQIMLGVFSVQLGLKQPLLTISHQLIAALLVAFLSALSFRRPKAENLGINHDFQDSLFEVCHG